MVKAIRGIIFAASGQHNNCTEKLRSPNSVSQKPGGARGSESKKRDALPEQGVELLKNL
jgi:hypothetical protein